LKVGDPVKPSQLLLVAQEIKNELYDLGYIKASVSSSEEEIMLVDNIKAVVDVKYSVISGPKVIMGKAILEGNIKTKDRVIYRELKKSELLESQSMSPQSTKDFEQRLYGLGLFQVVEMKPVGGKIVQREQEDESIPEVQEKDLKISVKERPGGSIEFGPGYRTDLGIIGFAELNYRNLGGWNRGVFLRSQISRKVDDKKYQFLEQKHTAIYVEPYLFDWDLRFRTQFDYSKSDDIKYLKKEKVS
jgi:outer membrane protein insertion porin family